jgi:hypothetical protein
MRLPGWQYQPIAANQCFPMSDSPQFTGTYQPDGPEADFAYWAKMGTWEWHEGAAVLVGINPNLTGDEAKLRSSVNRQALIKYKGILDLAVRAYADLDRHGSGPEEWLDWARKINLPIPPELETQVERLRSSSQTASIDRQVRIEQLEPRVAQLKAALVQARSAADQTPTARERESMLKLIIGMAVQGYRYDPKAKRNDSVRDIANDLENCGVSLSDDTVRKYLAEGAELVQPKESRER